MAYSRQPERDRAIDRLVDVFWLIAHRTDGLTAGLLRRLWKLVQRGLAPLPWSARFGLGTVLLAVPCLWLGQDGTKWVFHVAGFEPEQVKLLADMGWVDACDRLSLYLFGTGIFLGVAALAGFIRRRFFHFLLKAALAAFVVGWILTMHFAIQLPGDLHFAESEVFGEFARNQLWIGSFLIWLPFALLGLVVLVNLARRSVHGFYGKPLPPAARPPLGDRVIEDVQTYGGDKRFRTSTYWAAFAHILVFFIIPLLNRGCMEDPYGIPKGSGEQVQQKVEVKRVKKEKEMVLNLNSPILFYKPELDKKVLEEVMKDTENTYVASSLKSMGKGGGKKGGWPHGMENARVRFIRLEYSGGDWDQQMGKGADYNLLVEFKKHTGFKIADKTESLPIRQLRRFPKDRAPPFVFITGSKNINATADEIRTLRWYCIEEGGMIFADNGGGNFNSAFRRLMTRTFPELEWVDISSDDIIYQMPFLFENGAPPLFHHSGNRALGLKYQGRWICFYHQGDLNDAWQTGHSGVSDYVADQAYKMGINVINYAFNQYYAIHYGE